MTDPKRPPVPEALIEAIWRTASNAKYSSHDWLQAADEDEPEDEDDDDEDDDDEDDEDDDDEDDDEDDAEDDEANP